MFTQRVPAPVTDVVLKTVKLCQKLINKATPSNAQRLFTEFCWNCDGAAGPPPGAPATTTPPPPLRSRDLAILAAVILQSLVVVSRRCQSAYTRAAQLETMSVVIRMWQGLTPRDALQESLVAWLYTAQRRNNDVEQNITAVLTEVLPEDVVSTVVSFITPQVSLQPLCV